MAKISKRTDAKGYRSVGTTYDYVRILEPKTPPKGSTMRQIRMTLDKIMGERSPASADGGIPPGTVFVERRPQGDYAVRRAGMNRASAVLPTQAEAIARARELAPGARLDVERGRHAGDASPDQWRKT